MIVDADSEETEWSEWSEEYGYVASEIYKEIKNNSHLLDVADGNPRHE